MGRKNSALRIRYASRDAKVRSYEWLSGPRGSA